MDIDDVPAPLRERLGPGATGGLIQLFDLARYEGRADVIAACAGFERRLVDEIAGVRVQAAQVEGSLRVEIAQMGASLRLEMTGMGAGLRQEMTEMGAGLRQEMTEMGASLRQDMARMETGIRQDMASGRVELFKWCFLFWVGQVLAMAGLMGVMFRVFRP